VTTLWLTASLFNAFIEEAPEMLQGVARILTGGEQLSPRHIRRAYDHLSHTCLINGYGPTESTTFATCYSIPPGMDGESSIPIGRPIANTRVYILDGHLQPVPVGVPGELCIGGDGLARGYLNRPDLTVEKFIPDPFANDPGFRLYRTGDLARYLPDGTIEFLGRIDHQVKIRGFRIEPGEIESVLAKHPGIREAVVAAREDIPGDKRLVAYLVPTSGTAPPAGELRRFLAEQLPEYMIPSAFVPLDSLPLTPNGKVDRRALPAPDSSRLELEESYVAPQTPVELAIAELWAEVLRLERVGIHDNFFHMGGHSLLATQVISRIRNLLQVEVPLRDLFESQTIAAFSPKIEALLWKRPGEGTTSDECHDFEEGIL
jgi:acyl-coenzyme A synthetase/AMP-(fatty) acid ligase/acyl carrier protein